MHVIDRVDYTAIHGDRFQTVSSTANSHCVVRELFFTPAMILLRVKNHESTGMDHTVARHINKNTNRYKFENDLVRLRVSLLYILTTVADNIPNPFTRFAAVAKSDRKTSYAFFSSYRLSLR